MEPPRMLLDYVSLISPKRAHQQLSFLTSSTPGKTLKTHISSATFMEEHTRPMNVTKSNHEEEGPDWVVRSKFEAEMGNFMMEKKYHLKRLEEMLDQQQNDMHEQFSQILSTLDDKTTNKEPTLAITTRSGTTTHDPSYPNQPNSALIVTNETTAKEGVPTKKENPNTPNPETPLSSTLHHPSKSSNVPFHLD
nr:hypothetical protein [Tanacetum cinerariifolium]